MRGDRERIDTVPFLPVLIYLPPSLRLRFLLLLLLPRASLFSSPIYIIPSPSSVLFYLPSSLLHCTTYSLLPPSPLSIEPLFPILHLLHSPSSTLHIFFSSFVLFIFFLLPPFISHSSFPLLPPSRLYLSHFSHFATHFLPFLAQTISFLFWSPSYASSFL